MQLINEDTVSFVKIQEVRESLITLPKQATTCESHSKSSVINMKESNGDKRREEKCDPATPLQVNQDGVQGADEPEAPQPEFEQVSVEVVS